VAVRGADYDMEGGRPECKERHGAMKGCGLQFTACLVAKIRGKADLPPPVIGTPPPPPDGEEALDCR
jgi:hypothetical protein